MPPNDVTHSLDTAVLVVKDAGIDCTGWMLQFTGDGYVAWLYRDDDEGSWSLFEEVNVFAKPAEAAAWCLREARTLVSG